MDDQRFTVKADLAALLRLLAAPAESPQDVFNRLLGASALSYLVQLPPTEFEGVVGRSLEAQGYKVQQVGGRGDEGVDLFATRGELRIAVQCKRYDSAMVTPSHVREFLGAMVGASAARGILVTTSSFTEAARRFAKDKPMELIDSTGLLDWLTRRESGGRRGVCFNCGTVATYLTEWTHAWNCARCRQFNTID